MPAVFDVRPISSDNLNDFLTFFEGIEFKEHPHWSACYCYSFHFTGNSEQWNKEDNRSAVIKLIKENKMSGYLAYHKKNPVGWCNVNNRLNFQRLLKYYDLLEPDHKKVCSLVCFLIHPDFRRRGITQQILNRIESDYRLREFEIIEAYPTKRSLSYENQYMGSLDFYKKNGFDIVKEFRDYCLVRKFLH